jgi:hypothetical protein
VDIGYVGDLEVIDRATCGRRDLGHLGDGPDLLGSDCPRPLDAHCKAATGATRIDRVVARDDRHVR